ncbi:MAG: hypothetical protein ABSH12_02615 [Endomicrobiales bacterium]|jgi:hypothetical protein
MNFINGILSAALLARRVIDDEVRNVQRQIVRVAFALVCVAASFILILAAAGFFLWGIEQYFAVHLPPAMAACTVSAVAFLLAVIFAGIAKWHVSGS